MKSAGGATSARRALSDEPEGGAMAIETVLARCHYTFLRSAGIEHGSRYVHGSPSSGTAKPSSHRLRLDDRRPALKGCRAERRATSPEGNPSPAPDMASCSCIDRRYPIPSMPREFSPTGRAAQFRRPAHTPTIMRWRYFGNTSASSNRQKKVGTDFLNGLWHARRSRPISLLSLVSWRFGAISTPAPVPRLLARNRQAARPAAAAAPKAGPAGRS